jgi:hypothetical protein
MKISVYCPGALGPLGAGTICRSIGPYPTLASASANISTSSLLWPATEMPWRSAPNCPIGLPPIISRPAAFNAAASRCAKLEPSGSPAPQCNIIRIDFPRSASARAFSWSADISRQPSSFLRRSVCRRACSASRCRTAVVSLALATSAFAISATAPAAATSRLSAASFRLPETTIAYVAPTPINSAPTKICPPKYIICRHRMDPYNGDDPAHGPQPDR